MGVDGFDRTNRNAKAFLKAYHEVWAGEVTQPRGTLCREVQDFRMELDMEYSPLTSFAARKLNLDYAKRELIWYIGADKFDKSIEQYASTWQKIRQKDGSYFSNYGQYIFPDQFRFVVQELLQDRWSRRASIVLLKPEHLFHENKDVVCTYGMNFSIRNSQLHMRVHMRSNDIIFGMTNDVFCFSMIYRMVFAILCEDDAYKDLRPGRYVHLVDSMHVYDRHFAMIEQLWKQGLNGYQYIEVPWPTAREAKIAADSGYVGREEMWGNWLNT